MASAHTTKKRKAFSLIEGILALALFAASALAISQVCYNCLFSMDIADKASMDDAIKDQFISAILTVTDYDSLQDGIEIEAIDGESYTVYGEAEPTQILNLFKLTITAQKGMQETKTTMFVVRPNSWYEQQNERADLLEDRADFIEDKRREWEAENK